MHDQPTVTTYLFTDIEGSTLLWEQDAERMRPALARHDALARAAVESNHGVVVKTLGDGVHAVFDDPLDAVVAGLQLQLSLADPEATGGVALRVRCGMHSGIDERRDNDFFGKVVNRAARIMGAAHGGQVLLSQALAALVMERLPAGVALRDLGTVRLRDLASHERVYQVLHPQLLQRFPPLRSLEATPNNLPQQLTSFIGRERDLLDVKRLLQNTRLITFLGAGGLGKTRLSLQVAANAMDDFPDGVWFVDLAPLPDEQLVSQAVASALGVKEEAGRPVHEALVNYVKDRQLLIVLDNCEHLMHACAEVTKQLLQAGPRVKILASSREHLRVMGETTYAVPSLSVPDPRKTVTLEALTQFEAIRLFIDRATAVQPNFKLTDQNAAAVADICLRLDGIPLAIELAAARVRALSVEIVASRLNDRFRLLTRGDTTALPRQQTLRASIDWSYDLLSETERALLRRLAVFAGGWTLDAAEAVGADGCVAETDVVDILTNLVEKSLVVLDAEGQRYRLLETVRQYAQERLQASSEVHSTRARHLTFYLELAEKASPELVGPTQGAWLARLGLERENLLAAHAWCDQAAGGAELGLRLVFSVKLYMIYGGLLALGHRVTIEALIREGASNRSLARCRALHSAGQLGFFMGRYAEAQRYLEESLSISRELGDKGRTAVVLQALGMASLGQNNVAAARGHLEEALAIARELGSKRELAAALNALAQLHRVEGAVSAAEPLYEQALVLARDLEDRESIAIGLLNLAMVSIVLGSAGRAQAMLLEALAIADNIGSKRAGQSVLEVSAGLAVLRAEWPRAARLYGAAQSQMKLTGLHRDPADEAFLAPLIAQARVALDAARFAAAEIAGHALAYEDAIMDTRAWLEGGIASL